ncbi:VanZ family protein [Salinibacterium sp. SYSU T00001]|uniref:VanZ family protein n=1 Tax=Homoserinimonas sedimenticola TaxID=2986805 RepID=UPI0022366297|nr:VanZ family protein [Salinibacterium sedimenticola]MCW4386517.1 VanZ family protein [Salinibacterium sedimenticola]
MLLRHPVLSIATLGYLAVVAWVTLGPQPLDDEGRGILMRIIRRLQGYDATDWITYSGVEFTANVLMFVPIGVFFVLLLGRRGWWAAILLGVGLTVGIETTQLFLHDRVPDVRDLASNSIGTVIGVLAALLVTWPKARRLARGRSRGASAVRT